MSLCRASARRQLLPLLAIAAWVAACGEEEAVQRSSSRGFGGGTGTAPVTKVSATGASSGTAAQAEGAGGEGEETVREAIVYRDEDFVESERNRDPFRSYIGAFRAQSPDELQRRVIMPTTSIEEMRLIAIIGGLPRPKAMLVDPMGMGHTVERGDYVGRPQVIQATGSVAMVLNWRIDRIRDNEVVLTRQDPTDPTRPSLTRVIPLHEEVATR